MSIISAKNIKKQFGSRVVLRDVSIKVDSGEIVAIMGPSGSGKTTLLHSLAAISTIDGGKISFNGNRVDVLSDNARSRLRRKEFGFIFQFSQLVPELTALDNVALPLLLNGSRRNTAYDEAKKWLRMVDIARQSVDLPDKLSGGQAQRVAIARAMITHPKVLFADEPTGSLDSRSSEEIMKLFIGMARNNNTAVIIVTHDPSIARYANRIITMRDGLLIGEDE